jgi:uncharacterized protein
MTEPVSHAGHFVWHDLVAPDAARGRDFYVQLLGWNTSEMPMGDGGNLTVFAVGQSQVADVVPLDPALGVPPHWMCYLSVQDVDEAARTAVALGGKLAEPAFDTPYGRIALLQDPGGAYVRVVSTTQAPVEPPWPPAQGTFCWWELMVPDPVAVKPFYEQVFGWRQDQDMDMGQDGTYHLFRRGEAMAAGMMKLPPDVPMAHWLPYIAVDAVDSATARAVGLGATQLVAPNDVPGTGRFSVIRDPAGAVVALFTAAPM